MASNPDIEIITGTKLKYLSEKQNDYGTDHMFQLLRESPLKRISWIRRYEKLFWEHHGKYYLEINAVQIKELLVETCFKQDNPYIVELTFSKYDFQKGGEQITGYSFSEVIKNLLTFYISTEWDYQNQL